MTQFKHPTLQEILDAQTSRREYIRYLPIARYVLYPIGARITWLAIRIGLSSEVVSWLSGLSGLIAYLCLISSQDQLLPIGIGLLCFFNLLDCIDGGIARTMKTENPYGQFLDSFMNWIDMGFWALIGVMVFRHPELLFFPDPIGNGPVFWLVAGGLICYAFNLLWYIERTFDQYVRDKWEDIKTGNKADTKNTSKDEDAARISHKKTLPLNVMSVLRKINHNLRVRETHYFLFILAYWNKAVDFFLVFFLFYYVLHIILLVFIYCRRGRQLRKSHLQEPL